MRFSTSAYAPAERLEAWREIYGRTLLKLDIEPIDIDNFHTDVLMRRLPGLSMIVGTRSATHYRRNAQRIDNDDLVMSFGLAGSLEASQLGRTVSIEQGEAVVVTAGSPGYVRMPASGHTLTLSMPKRAISASVPDLDAALCRAIPADNAALRLLTRYVGALEDTDTFAAP